MTIVLSFQNKNKLRNFQEMKAQAGPADKIDGSSVLSKTENDNNKTNQNEQHFQDSLRYTSDWIITCRNPVLSIYKWRV